MTNTDIDLTEPNRTQEELEPNNNPFGFAVAQFVIAFNNAQGKEEMDGDKVHLRAWDVRNDARFGDHVKIAGDILDGINVGAETFRQVIIHTAPPGRTTHTVRFVNFGKEENIDNFHYGQIGQVVQEVIAYLLGYDFEQG